MAFWVRFDLIWTIQKNKIRNKTSEGCPGLDEEWVAIEQIIEEFSGKNPNIQPHHDQAKKRKRSGAPWGR